jgi:hypothetical protein
MNSNIIDMNLFLYLPVNYVAYDSLVGSMDHNIGIGYRYIMDFSPKYSFMPGAGKRKILDSTDQAKILLFHPPHKKEIL